MEPGNWIALVAVAITAIGSWLTYRIASRALDGQRALADRQAAAEILDATVLELAEVDHQLAELETSFGLLSRDHYKAREGIAELDDALGKMEIRSQRLGIRFRNDLGAISLVAQSFEAAKGAVHWLVNDDAVVLARSLALPGIGHRSQELLDKLDQVRPPAAEVVQRQRKLFQLAQGVVTDAAHAIVGINVEARIWTSAGRRRARLGRIFGIGGGG